MTTSSNQSLYDFLTTNAGILALVPKTSILMGIQNAQPSTYPCIVITQIGGSDMPGMGYKTAASGSKFAIERPSYQMDIFNQDVPKTNLTILDAMRMPLMANGYYKTSDNDVFDDKLNAYRKITRWETITSHDD
jgi:hypothetical protein